jgi:hypothetical protein
VETTKINKILHAYKVSAPYPLPFAVEPLYALACSNLLNAPGFKPDSCIILAIAPTAPAGVKLSVLIKNPYIIFAFVACSDTDK